MRRSALRVLFRVARIEFGFEGEPTLDIVLPPKTSLATRPLTDDEIALGRSYSLHTLVVTRQPAAWALCEATAVTSELPFITVSDLDLGHADGPKVRLHGGTKRNERWAEPAELHCGVARTADLSGDELHRRDHSTSWHEQP